jgi:peptide/nickel transport system substrate-binding protein
VVGSGPFKVAEFRPGQRIVLEKFDKFFIKGKPYLDKVIINISPDTSSLMLGLERGDIQMLPYATGSVDLKRMKANPNLVLTDKGFEGIGAIN